MFLTNGLVSIIVLQLHSPVMTPELQDNVSPDSEVRSQSLDISKPWKDQLEVLGFTNN